MKLYEVNGTYGSGKTPTTVFCAETNSGLTWYVCEGSQNVNATYDKISEGVNVEELADVDYFSGITINSLEDLETAINS